MIITASKIFNFKLYYSGSPLDYFIHEQPVFGVCADPLNSSIFCSACDDGRILIFDTRESNTGKNPAYEHNLSPKHTNKQRRISFGNIW
jgi:hypothetical protein